MNAHGDIPLLRETLDDVYVDAGIVTRTDIFKALEHGS